jgi:hypothetical protein
MPYRDRSVEDTDKVVRTLAPSDRSDVQMGCRHARQSL